MENRRQRKLKDFNPNNCPVVYSLNKIGNKWKLLILHYIKLGNDRFSTLQKVIPEISRQTLTNQLRELEKDGILERIIYPQIPPKVEYKLTPFGLEVLAFAQSANALAKASPILANTAEEAQRGASFLEPNK